jgi:hypothetical protein
MRPSFIIAVLLSMASMGAAAMLFWRELPKTAPQRTAPPSVEIKWGEGSEAGVPDAALHK